MPSRGIMIEKPTGFLVGTGKPHKKPSDRPKRPKKTQTTYHSPKSQPEPSYCEIDPFMRADDPKGCIYMGQFPLYCKIVSEANNTDHWTVKHKRRNAQKIEVMATMSDFPTSQFAKHPLLIRIIRLGGRKMDDDNFQNAVKAIRDAIADQLRPGLAPGQADNTDQIVWDYRQKPGKERCILVEFWQRHKL